MTEVEDLKKEKKEGPHLIGEKMFYRVESRSRGEEENKSMHVPVEVVHAEKKFGRYVYDIEPINGSGQISVRKGLVRDDEGKITQ